MKVKHLANLDALAAFRRITAIAAEQEEEIRTPLVALLCFVKIPGDSDIVARRVGTPPREFEQHLADGLSLLRDCESFHALFHRLRASI